VTAVFIASALNSSTGENNIRSQVANVSSQVANVSSQVANVSSQVANVSSQVANALNQVANALNQVANSSNLIVNTQSNSELLESINFSKILRELFDLYKPFVLAILITGIGFIYIMYLTSRKRRRTFSRIMKLYDYCNTLAFECGIPDITRDIQRVVMKTLQEKERKKHTISMAIGYPEKKIFKVKSDKYDTPFVLNTGYEISFPVNTGRVGTLFLAERRSKRLKRSENRPNHYWILISEIGILMQNTIGTFDRPFRQEVFRLPEEDKERPNLEDQLEHRKIVPIHCNLIVQIYDEYRRMSANEQ
jgi:hypothetical protein